MCQFNIPFSGSADSLIQRAGQEIEKASGILTGDSARGNFHLATPIGSIEGSYQIAGQEIALVITKKPFLLSCSRIQNELSKVMQ